MPNSVFIDIMYVTFLHVLSAIKFHSIIMLSCKNILVIFSKFSPPHIYGNIFLTVQGSQSQTFGLVATLWDYLVSSHHYSNIFKINCQKMNEP